MKIEYKYFVDIYQRLYYFLKDYQKNILTVLYYNIYYCQVLPN